MMKEARNLKSADSAFSVVSEAGNVIHGRLAALAELVDPAATVIVTDSRIYGLYGSSFPRVPLAIVPCGEEAKSLASLESLYARFLELGLDRKSTVLSIGGGSVSDLSGFAASTWMRGVRFVTAPTTLLSMVDASIGGKNGVDFRARKNMIGTFHQPEFVYCDVSLAGSLPGTEFRSGMAEMIKHGILDGEEHFTALETFAARYSASLHGNLAGDLASGSGLPELEALVAASQRVKLDIVRRDAKESGPRRLLNLGHTIGHAVEAATGLPHGFAVAAGLGCACRLSVSLGLMGDSTARRVSSLLAAWRLPSSLGEAAEAAEAAATAAAESGKDGDIHAPGADLRARAVSFLMADKKREAEKIHFALPVDIGRVVIRAFRLESLESFILEDR